MNFPLILRRNGLRKTVKKCKHLTIKTRKKCKPKIDHPSTVFLKGYGEVKKIELNGNKIILDSSSILAFTKNLIFNSNLSNPLKM